MAGSRAIDTSGAVLTSIQPSAESLEAAQAVLNELTLEGCFLVTTEGSVCAERANVARKLEEASNPTSVATPPFTVSGEFGTESVEFPESAEIKRSSLEAAQAMAGSRALDTSGAVLTSMQPSAESLEAAQAVLDELALEGCFLVTTEESVRVERANVGRKLEEASNPTSVATPPLTVSGESGTESLKSVGPWERFPESVEIKRSSREAAQAVLDELALEGCFIVTTEESVRAERANVGRKLEEASNPTTVETPSFTVSGEFGTEGAGFPELAEIKRSSLEAVQAMAGSRALDTSGAVLTSMQPSAESLEAAQAVLDELALEGCFLVTTEESVRAERANVGRKLEEVHSIPTRRPLKLRLSQCPANSARKAWDSRNWQRSSVRRWKPPRKFLKNWRCKNAS
ncbi:hypothetical protein L596_018026 [Steinernema carpocapsae]|nr:hypothetical protein L596_018026 [Steinernema carpocapsae]